MVRSLLLAPSFPPAAGGMETLLYQTARRLADPPLVLAPRPARAPDLPIRAVSTSPRTMAGRGLYRLAWALHPSLHYTRAFWRPAVTAMRDHRPHVIQAGHVYLAPLAWAMARRSGKPFVVYAFGQEVWRHGRPMGLTAADSFFRGRALAGADAVLALGDFTAGLLADWPVMPGRIVRVPFGADAKPGTPAPGGATLLSVGRLVPRKGVDTVVRALPRLAETFPSLAYRVVGSGPDECRLRDLARTEGVADRVSFLGHVSADVLDREYRECTLFVLPSRRTEDGELEGLGLVYLEAAAWGRPVVAGRSGGEADAVVDGVTGLLVDGESVAAVAAAIGDLLAQPARRRALGDAGRRRVITTHNWQRAAAVVDQTLERLVAPGANV